MRQALTLEAGPTDASITAKPPHGDTTRRRHWGGPVVGGFYLSMGGVHLGIVAADTETYRHFADAGLFPFVRDGWQNIFMTQPAAFGLALMAGEMALGILLLLGGRFATVGWAGVVVFHVLLMLFGFGIWLWCIPALTALVYLAHKDTTTIWAR
jgi:hypothetical protein